LGANFKCGAKRFTRVRLYLARASSRSAPGADIIQNDVSIEVKRASPKKWKSELW
jgi:hypothetical protein